MPGRGANFAPPPLPRLPFKILCDIYNLFSLIDLQYNMYYKKGQLCTFIISVFRSAILCIVYFTAQNGGATNDNKVKNNFKGYSFAKSFVHLEEFPPLPGGRRECSNA